MRHQWDQPTPPMIASRELIRRENLRRSRRVLGLALEDGGHYHAVLEGGGWVWYPRGSTRAAMIADLQDQAYDVRGLE